MTETPPKSAARLLVEARAAGRFSGEWPAELLPGQLAGLMTGCQRNENLYAYDLNMRLIADSIKSGTLETRIQARPPKTKVHDIDRMGSVRIVATERIEQKPIQWIDRHACAAWLRAIGEHPGELLLAWLGDALQVFPEMKGDNNDEPPLVKRRMDAIVKAAKALGYEPLKIAYGGKAAIKAECLKDAKLFTDATFDKAWKAAKKAGMVEVDNVEIYRGQ